MTCKIHEENKMLVDKLKQHVAQETNKLEHDVSQLRQDTDKEIQLVGNNMKKLVINLDDKINTHVKRSTVKHEILCNEVISELSAAKQEIDAFRQGVSKKNQEIQNWFSSKNKTELETRMKIAEKNGEVVELKKADS